MAHKELNPIAQALGRMAAGHPKTMSKAAIKQRRDAGKASAIKRKQACKQSIVKPQNNTRHESVSGV